MSYSLNNIRLHYDTMYGKPTDHLDAIDKINQAYNELMNDASSKSEDGIAELYRELDGKNLPAYYWILEAIHRVSKKRIEKRNIRYLVGMVRNWSLYGFGNTSTSDEEEVFNYFRELSGVDLNEYSRKILTSLMRRFGVIKTMRLMSYIQEVDVSSYLAEVLALRMVKTYMTEFFNDKESIEKVSSYFNIIKIPTENNEGIESNFININETNGKLDYINTSVKDNGTNRKMNDITKLMMIYIEKFLQEGDEEKSIADIVDMLHGKGFPTATQQNISSRLNTIMKYNSHIIKLKDNYTYK